MTATHPDAHRTAAALAGGAPHSPAKMPAVSAWADPPASGQAVPVAGPAGAPAPALAPARAPVLEPRALAELQLLDPGGQQLLVTRVLGTYRVSLARLLQQMSAALAARDLAAVRLAAHTLKSPSGSVGALALADWCARTEAAARENRLEEVPGLIQHLQAEGQRVDAAVRQLLSD